MASTTLVLAEAYRGQAIPAGAHVVALTTSAQRDLAAAGIGFNTPGEYAGFTTLTELEDRYTAEQLGFFASYDELWHDTLIAPGMPVSPLRMDGYLFKIIVDSYIIELWRIGSVVREVRPDAIELWAAHPQTADGAAIDFAVSAAGNAYPQLAREVAAALAAEYGASFTVDSPPPAPLSRATLRARLRASRAGALAARISRHGAAEPALPAELDELAGQRVLFASEWWGLEPILAHALAHAARTWVLADGVLFGYRGRLLTSASRVRAASAAPGSRDASELLGHEWVRTASEFAGTDVTPGLAARLEWLDAWTTTLTGVALTFERLLRRESIAYVVANQRPSAMSRVLAYVATTREDTQYLYGTHGYDTYEVDRTFLELPCDRYFTHDEEYRAYFERAFAAQSLYPVPEVGVARLG